LRSFTPSRAETIAIVTAVAGAAAYAIVPRSDLRALALVFGATAWSVSVAAYAVVQEAKARSSAAGKVPVGASREKASDELLVQVLGARIDRMRASVDSQRQLCLAVLGVDAVVATIIASSSGLQTRLGSITGLGLIELVFLVLLSIGLVLMGAMSPSSHYEIEANPSLGEVETALRKEEAAIRAADIRQTAYLYVGVVLQLAAALIALVVASGS
jgi:hypothetical protein